MKIESPADPAHAPRFSEPGASNAGSGAVRGKPDPRGSRETGARSHEANASNATDAAFAEEKGGEEEIEVTEEMIDAGVNELELSIGIDGHADADKDTVKAIFRAMMRASESDPRRLTRRIIEPVGNALGVDVINTDIGRPDKISVSGHGKQSSLSGVMHAIPDEGIGRGGEVYIQLTDTEGRRLEVEEVWVNDSLAGISVHRKGRRVR